MELTKVKVKNEKFEIEAKIIKQGDDIVIIIGGGKFHIGAVGVTLPPLPPENISSTSIITVPGHKDDIVSKIIGEKVAKELKRNVSVIAGIHYDNLDKNEIEEIISLCNNLGEKIIDILRKEYE